MHLLPASDDIALLAATVRRRAKQALCARLEEYGLGPQQFWVLLHLHDDDDDGLSLHELALKTGADDPTICRVVKRLSQRGLVRTRPHPEDRRRGQLHPTPRGRRLASSLRTLADDMRTGIERGLSPRERKQLCVLLRKVIANAERLALDDVARRAIR